jgi:hypothetical protein
MESYIVADETGIYIYSNITSARTHNEAAATADMSTLETYGSIYIPPSTYISHTMYVMSDDITFELSSAVDPPPFTTWTYYVDSESFSYSEIASDSYIDSATLDMSTVYYGMSNV